MQADLSFHRAYMSLLVLLCSGLFTVVVHDLLSTVWGTQVLPNVDNA